VLQSIRLERFKAFRDSGWIDLRPLTVLAGANSSGKSSVLQSLLLLRQSLESDARRGHLRLDGKYLQLSSLSDVAFSKPPAGRAFIRYGLRFRSEIRTWKAQRYVPGASLAGAHQVLLAELTLTFRSAAEASEKVVVSDIDVRTGVSGFNGPRLRLRYKPDGSYAAQLTGGQGLRGIPAKHVIVGAKGRQFLPEFVEVRGEGVEVGADTLRPMPAPFADVFEDLRDTLETRLEYLGPLREQPHRAYLHGGGSQAEIGERGEFAAQVLWQERDQLVRYARIGSGTPRQMRLLDAVNAAFVDVGLTQPMDVRSTSQVMYQILLGLPDQKKQVTISDVGFGVSQLLPIVVMCLRAPEDAILLMEQPEIHLHPRLQGNLADFFVALSATGKRFVVETHSDHFVDRLRRRIAEDRTDALKNAVGVLFARPSEDSQGTSLEPLRIDRYGSIENWPRDFMPEAAAEAEAIVKAGLHKRRS
jgi:predicted ATPase